MYIMFSDTSIDLLEYNYAKRETNNCTWPSLLGNHLKFSRDTVNASRKLKLYGNYCACNNCGVTLEEVPRIKGTRRGSSHSMLNVRWVSCVLSQMMVFVWYRVMLHT